MTLSFIIDIGAYGATLIESVVVEPKVKERLLRMKVMLIEYPNCNAFECISIIIIEILRLNTRRN